MGILTGRALGNLWPASIGAVDPTVYLILASGQSNLYGEPYTQAYTGAMPSTKAKWWKAGLTNDFVAFPPLHPVGTFPLASEGFPGFYGPCLPMLVELERLYPNKTFWLVAHCAPGRGFNAGAGTFSASGEDCIAFMGKLDRSEERLQALALSYKYCLHILQQGENEAFNTTDSGNYLVSLQAYKRDVRSRTTPLLPQATSRLSINNTRFSSTAIRDSIRATHASATITDALVNQDDLGMFADPDTFVRHFTAAGYETMGKRWAALSQANPANALAPNNTSVYVDPGTQQVWDFTALSALPAGFTAINNTPTFSTGLNLTAGSSVWGSSCVDGPVWDLRRPLIFKFKGWVTSNAGVGAYSASRNWDTISGKSALMTRQTIYHGLNSQGTISAFLTTADYRCTMTRSGPDIHVLTQRLNADDSVNSWHGLRIIVNYNFDANPKILIDAYNTALKIYSIKN